MYDVLIIGCGPAGMAAAMYLQRASLKIAIIEKNAPGGKLLMAKEIANYPGFTSIEGSELAYKMYDSIMNVPYLAEEVVAIHHQDVFQVVIKEQTLLSKYLICATGLQHQKIQVDNFEQYLNNGISYCAVCDGSLYKNKHVAIISDDEKAFEEVQYLANLASQVHWLTPIASTTNIANVRVWENYRIEALIGDNRLERINIVNKTQNDEQMLDVDGLFIATSLIPTTSLLHDFSVFDEQGFIITDENKQTSTPGLYAVGDCVQKRLRQVTTAVADGAIAATAILRQKRG